MCIVNSITIILQNNQLYQFINLFRFAIKQFARIIEVFPLMLTLLSKTVKMNNKNKHNVIKVFIFRINTNSTS